jgi:hypothetical protein
MTIAIHRLSAGAQQNASAGGANDWPKSHAAGSAEPFGQGSHSDLDQSEELVA